MSFAPHRGHEQTGHRPALVISPRVYNARSSVLFACPITSNTSAWPWKVPLFEGDAIEGAILVDQIRAIDPVAREVRMTGQAVADALLADILTRLATLVT